MSYYTSSEGVKPVLEGRDLALIAPYREQKRFVFSNIQTLSVHIYMRDDVKNTKVATVDGFQGHEREFVLLDFTGIKGKPGQVGFLSDPRRQNVGLTRAKNGLIVIGNLKTLQAALPLLQKKGNAPALANFIQQVVLERECFVYWPADTIPEVNPGLSIQPLRPPGSAWRDTGPSKAGFGFIRPGPRPMQKRPASPPGRGTGQMGQFSVHPPPGQVDPGDVASDQEMEGNS